MDNSTTSELINSLDIIRDPVSDDVKHVFQLANYVILCGGISLFGVGANIVNIIVFVKQGFKDSINISLLGLAVADLACSITRFWTSTCHNPLFQNLNLPFQPLDVMYATGGMPHECFNRITSFITAFITLERCLCIAMPLKVKTIINPFRTKIIIASIFIGMFILFSPFYFVNRLEWRFSISSNTSMLIMTYTAERALVDSITFFIHSVFLSSALLFSVTICTTILVVKLNKKTKWRQAAVAQKTLTQEVTSVKDKKVVKMVTLISTIFIVCYIPPTANFLAMVFYPEFSISGKLHNSIYVSWAVALVLEAVNSSVNIFVYFHMSTKFRETFTELFFWRKHDHTSQS